MPTGFGQVIALVHIGKGEICVLSKGNTYVIEGYFLPLKVGTRVSFIVTEAEPMLGIVSLISCGCLDLLHVVEVVLQKNDTVDNIGLEGQGSIGLSGG